MLVFVEIVGLILMGFLAMTLDVGAAAKLRRVGQTAADAGAFGGGQEILREMPHDSIVASALAEAVRNGFSAGDITVNHPPATGTYAGNNQYVEVLIHRSMATLFGGIFNFSSLDVGARAVAGVGAADLNCIYTLDPSGADALFVDGALSANCGIVVNSTSPNALWVKPGANLKAPSVTVAGGIHGSGDITGSSATGVAPVINPLKDLAFPTDNDCSAHPSTVTISGSGTTALYPGVYCGGIDIANGGATAFLNPGNYIIRGGGISVATGGNIIGSGITIFLSTGSQPYTGMNITNSCDAQLSAPTSGAYEGILFFQDPLAPVPYTNTFSCNGTQTGTFYFPTQTVYFANGNGKLTIEGSVLAFHVSIKSGSEVELVNDPTANNAVKRLSLVQ